MSTMTNTYRVTAPNADAAVELARKNHPDRITSTSTRRLAPSWYEVTVTDYGSTAADAAEHLEEGA